MPRAEEDGVEADRRIVLKLTVPDDAVGARLDQILVRHLPALSRSALGKWIAGGCALVDGRTARAAQRLRGGEQVRLVMPPVDPCDERLAEDVPLEILYEDDFITAINKPPGMVVHPAKGHWRGTLAAAIAFRYQTLSQAGGSFRPGIVHRLDRDTSGVIVVARSDTAHFHLARQFAQRTVHKEYRAVVRGIPDRDRDQIDLPIGADPRVRERMAIRGGHSSSRSAETFFEVLERFTDHALLRVIPRTGRTHQIRVHLAGIGHPILCDRLYGGQSLDDCDARIDRQALHAQRLEIDHPHTGERLVLEAPLAPDMERLLCRLRRRPGDAILQ
jgi:23S rRNA pseudouridine1911/1915/1917 synthase